MDNDSSTIWTSQQRAAIFHSDGDLFVSASAGTGKTEVLTARSAVLLADPNRCPSPLNILVVTFTEAAAQQMKARIYKKIREFALSQPQDRHLANQLLLLPAAQICTIHAFCYRLIQEHITELGLDPGLRIIDQQGQFILKDQAVEQTLRWAWEQLDLQAGLEVLFRGRRISTVSEAILRTYQLLECMVDRNAWFKAVLEDLVQPDILASTAAKAQMQWLAEELPSIARQLQWLSQHAYGDKVSGHLASLADSIGRLAGLAQAGCWDQLGEKIRQIDHPKRPRSEALALDLAISVMTKGLSDLANLAILDLDFLSQTCNDTGLQAQTLVRLVEAFEGVYRNLKTRSNVLDFSDLERYALQLLCHKTADGYAPSRLAMELRDRYRFILVDEYQDINPVQHMILQMLHAERNLFGVGDVKQCIYAFRGAEPRIFMDCLQKASLGNGSGRVDLTVNFRSCNGILEFANLVFSRLMRPQVSGIEYDQSVYLVPALNWPENGPVVELHILDTTADNNQTDRPAPKGTAERRQRQAALIADLIRRIVGEGGHQALMVRDCDSDQMRPARYGDIVVLLRSPSVCGREYQRAMHAAGIPVMCSSASLLEALEVRDCINLLRIIDNPYRDIELASVLRGPFVGITDSDLVKIRIPATSYGIGYSLYEMVLHYCSSGQDRLLAAKLEGFIKTLEGWRHQARVGDLASLVWRIYLETGLLSRVLAQADGDTRRANLIRLHEQAIWFDRFADTSGGPALASFLDLIKALEESEMDALTGTSCGQQDAVAIMSIHRAKGLEFPIVILAEMEAAFNLRDRSQEILVDQRYGVGLAVIDDYGRHKRSSLAHQVIARAMMEQAIAEEMRLFYVAATRARDRFIMTGAMTVGTCRQVLELGQMTCDGPAVPYMIRGIARARNTGNLLAWTIYACHDQPSLRQALGLSPGSAKSVLEAHVHVAVETFEAELRSGLEQARGQALDGQTLSTIKARLEWAYPHMATCSCRAKWSVTDIVSQGQQGNLTVTPRLVQPEPDSELVGSATHLLLASLPLARPISRRFIGSVLQDLVEQGKIGQDLASRVDLDAIVRFFEGPIGIQVLDPANTVWREWAFTLAVRPNELLAGPNKDQDVCVLEGIVDMVVQTKEGLLVVDFKTGHGRHMERLYKRQVQLYARAAGTILERPVVAVLIYYLADGQAVEVI